MRFHARCSLALLAFLLLLAFFEPLTYRDWVNTKLGFVPDIDCELVPTCAIFALLPEFVEQRGMTPQYLTKLISHLAHIITLHDIIPFKMMKSQGVVNGLLGIYRVVELNAKEFGRRLRRARHERMLTQAELAKLVGCGQSLIAAYEGGYIQSVPFDMIERLASVLGKPPSYFISSEVDEDKELSLIRQYVEQIYRAMYGKIEPFTVPLYGSVPASDWDEAVVDQTGDRIGVLAEFEGLVDYALRVRGHSMAPTLLEGDIVYVCRRLEPKQRDIVVVRNRDKEVSLKRYIKFRDKVSLRPDNPDYDELKLEEVEILGIVIASLRRFR